jgi:hypothetical protein
LPDRTRFCSTLFDPRLQAASELVLERAVNLLLR